MVWNRRGLRAMQLFGIHTRLIKPKDDLVGILLDVISKQKLTIDDGDLLMLASKAISIVQGRLMKLDTIIPSEEAKALAEKYDLDPRFVDVVLMEARKVYGGVSGALLTVKSGALIPNAGVDQKNAPKGFVVLWPDAPHEAAENIRGEIFERVGKNVGVLIVDSHISPLRMGTTGLAVGIAGFNPIRDCRAERDLYGNKLFLTRHALADDLAGATHLLMGEANGSVPAVLVKGAPISLSEELDPYSVLIAEKNCLFMNCFV
ncbi:MAG: coenzyme F420-0:L-glutamate ligase [Candidatus Bathyarchaeota archaeon]|nr:MAG: coenzyme F420-0:L-glutamate ligase [Candidatus Bathyarchaeota archaeon]